MPHSAQEMERLGALHVLKALEESPTIKVLSFNHRDAFKPARLTLDIGGYEYTMTVEFEDPR